ncbi:hypothetical protein HWV62_24053 [Athelia sp. TMB]|nr:hypothetical protein HWV62_24053 [Athelia sp. TMB]
MISDRKDEDPLLRAKQHTVSKPSVTKLHLIVIVAAILVYDLGWRSFWDRASGCQNQNLAQYETEVNLRKAEEMQRELAWEGLMNDKRARENTRETQWEISQQERELAWEREMDDKRAKERAREAEWELAQQERERLAKVAWERQKKDQREKERAREAQWKISQQERERLSLSWGPPIAQSCISHGVKSYRAQLLDAASYSYNKIVACMETPITIHGVPRNASRCERQVNVSAAAFSFAL